MEILLALVAVAIVAFLIFRNSAVKGLEVLDVNRDGKVDTADAVAAVENIAKVVKPVVKKVAERAKSAVRSADKSPAPRRTRAARPGAKK